MTADCQPGDHPLDLSNPYPGPRPFPRPGKRVGEEPEKPLFFGRDSERQDLYDLLIAERIVVLYSPSGAGKTSLVQAALIPNMEDRGFEVLPVMRCSLEPEKKINPAANRYVLSLFLSLEADREPEERLPLADLVSRACKERSLNEYLSEREENAKAKAATSWAKGTVLIFDQFEEIFTEDITDQEEKAAFFRQISVALRHPRRWALFVMREEFLGSLESSIRRMPAQFRARFGLEYLDPSAATEAIVQPACQHGVEFQEDAAEKLVNNLRQVLDPGASGEGERKLGPYIEPVQLQLVCEQLWQKRIGALDAGTHPDAPPAISVDDVREFGDVDRALGTYYAGKVAEASENTGVRERKIREWIDLNLITGRGFRDQVQHEPDATRGLDNKVLTLLAKAHVLRAERRRDLTWYELSHDRWIWPVQKSNREWRKACLQDFQIEAEVWVEFDRPDDKLLRGRGLLYAERWAEEHPEDLEDHEEAFLSKSRERRRRQRKRIVIGAFVGAMVAGCVLMLLGYILTQQAEILVRDLKITGEAAAFTAQAELFAKQAEEARITADAAESTAAIAVAALATSRALRTQAVATQNADPLGPTSEALATQEVIENQALEQYRTAVAIGTTSSADEQVTQSQQTAVAQAAATLRPVSDTPTSTYTPTPTPTATSTPTPSDAEREEALLRRVRWREENGEPVFAYYTARPPVLDGVLEPGIEWTRPAYQANVVVFKGEQETGPDDASSRFYVTWDHDYLYLGVEVLDDVHVQESRGEELYLGDDVELQLDTELAGDFSQSSLSSDDGQLGFAVVNPATGAVEAYIWRPAARKGPLSLSHGARMTADGYELELAIPWPKINLAPPLVETPFGFCLNLSDTDTPGIKDQESMVSSCPRRKWGDPTTWGTLILVDW